MIGASELDHVDLKALRRRLVRSGWEPMKREGVLRAPSGKYFLLPKKLLTDLDYVSLRLVIEAILVDKSVQSIEELQSKIEGKKEDLMFLGCEVIGMPPGKLPVTHAPAFYSKSNRLLRASALAVQADRAVTKRKGIYERLTYSETKKSSYLIAVHVPIDTIPDPVGRAYVRRTARAVESLQRAVEREKQDELENDGRQIWTAEMCEAVLSFVEDKQFSEFKFQAIPDPIWIDGAQMNTDEIVVPLKTGVAEEIMSSMAAKLRQLRPSERVHVVGVPFESKDFSVIGEGDLRTVGILWRREGQSDLRVHAEMSRSAYEKMLQSQSKRIVGVSGVLQQRGSRWVLEVEGEPDLFESIYSPTSVASRASMPSLDSKVETSTEETKALPPRSDKKDD